MDRNRQDRLNGTHCLKCVSKAEIRKVQSNKLKSGTEEGTPQQNRVISAEWKNGQPSINALPDKETPASAEMTYCKITQNETGKTIRPRSDTTEEKYEPIQITQPK